LTCQAIIIFFKEKGNNITKTELELYKPSLINNLNLKEINLSSKNHLLIKENNCSDEGCTIINEIILKSNIERINLNCK
jgi:hypothetical protein